MSPLSFPRILTSSVPLSSMSLPRDALLSTTILILFYRNSNPPEWAGNTRFPNAIIHRGDAFLDAVSAFASSRQIFTFCSNYPSTPPRIRIESAINTLMDDFAAGVCTFFANPTRDDRLDVYNTFRVLLNDRGYSPPLFLLAMFSNREKTQMHIMRYIDIFFT